MVGAGVPARLALVVVAAVVMLAACQVPAPPPPNQAPNFVVTNASFFPALDQTTFVQSQPGAPLGTPCSLYPTLPTTVTASATVLPVSGQSPDIVVVDVDVNPPERIDLAPIPGTSTWTGTFPVAGADTDLMGFAASPFHFSMQFVTLWHNTSGGDVDAVPGQIRECA